MGRGARLLALAVSVVALGAAACRGESEPTFSASCGPNETGDGVSCTVQNLGAKRGRACLTVSVEPEPGVQVLSRRSCTAVLEPRHSQAVVPRFHASVAKRCVQDSVWSCKPVVLETARSLGENLPAER